MVKGPHSTALARFSIQAAASRVPLRAFCAGVAAAGGLAALGLSGGFQELVQQQCNGLAAAVPMWELSSY